MTGTPPATRPPVYSPFLRETLRRLSGERSCDPPGFYVGANTFRSILCSSQFGGLVTSLLQISIVFNNLVSVRFQKFNNIPPEKLFSVVDLFSLQLLLNSSTQLLLRLQQCHTFRLASPPLVRNFFFVDHVKSIVATNLLTLVLRRRN